MELQDLMLLLLVLQRQLVMLYNLLEQVQPPMVTTELHRFLLRIRFRLLGLREIQLLPHLSMH